MLGTFERELEIRLHEGAIPLTFRSSAQAEGFIEKTPSLVKRTAFSWLADDSSGNWWVVVVNAQRQFEPVRSDGSPTNLVIPESLQEQLTLGAAKLYNDFATKWLTITDLAADVPEAEFSYTREQGNAFFKFWLSGKELSFFALANKEPPAGQGPKLEQAAKIFVGRDVPPNLVVWLKKVRNDVKLLLQSVDWPDKSLGPSLFELAGFSIHNIAGMTGDDLDEIKNLILDSVKRIKGSGIPRAGSLIYGPVFLTDQLGSPNTLAFYRVPPADEVYIFPKTRFGPVASHSLIHELGHRYWRMLLADNKKSAWAAWNTERHDSDIPNADTSYPIVGDVLDIPVRGESRPTVLRVVTGRPTRYYFSDDKFVTSDQLDDWNEKKAQASRFPTNYAFTAGAEEHFCEAFALWCLGKLREPHLSKFKEIIG